MAELKRWQRKTMTAFQLFGCSVVITGLFGICAAIIATRTAEKRAAGLRARGIYPERGKERDEDVLRLLSVGEKIMAIRCYRDLHKVGLKDAKLAVETLQRKTA
jgi:ribosomal protein L7/L12